MKTTMMPLVFGTAAALVSQPTPRTTTTTALRAAAQPNLELIPGVDPTKTMPADWGWDPLGLAEVDLNLGSARDKNRPKNVVVKDYRDAELRHGRLAMLAAIAWPVQELYAGALAKGIDAKDLLTADGRSPSVLNGGLGEGPVALTVLGTALAIAALDLRALKIKERSGDDWLPGDYGFDPCLVCYNKSPEFIADMKLKELTHARTLSSSFSVEW